MFQWAIVSLVTGSVSAAAYLAFATSRMGSPSVWWLILIPNALFGGFAVYRLVQDRQAREVLMPKWGDASLGFVTTVGMFGLFYLGARFFVYPSPVASAWLRRVYSQFGSHAVLASHGTRVALSIVVVAVAEELTWRVLVMRTLAERILSRRAWIYAALLYAIAHVPTLWALKWATGSLNPLIVVAALIAGLAWGGLTRATGRVMPAIISHVLFDWAVLVMFPLGVASSP
jgi:membrane protease YdiL (CAAX protease family)